MSLSLIAIKQHLRSICSIPWPDVSILKNVSMRDSFWKAGTILMNTLTIWRTKQSLYCSSQKLILKYRVLKDILIWTTKKIRLVKHLHLPQSVLAASINSKIWCLLSIRTTQISGMQSRQVWQMMRCPLSRISLIMIISLTKRATLRILMNQIKKTLCPYCKTMTLIMEVVNPMRKRSTIC